MPGEATAPAGTVHATREGAALVLCLDNPAKRNAISPAMLRAISAEAARVGAEPEIRVIILTGAGEKAFCSGGDLDAMGSDTAAVFTATERLLAEACAALANAPVPVVALLNGACFGGGVQLALAADLRIAAEHARLAIPAARFGLVYSPEAVARLVHLIGLGHAFRVLAAGDVLSSADALALRLVEEVVAADALRARGAALAATFGAVPLPALRAYTAMIRAAAAGETLAVLREVQAGTHSDGYLAERLAAIGAQRQERRGG